MAKFRLVDGFFLLLLIALTFTFYKILSPFLLDIFLAIILVNLLMGIYTFFDRRLPSWVSSLIIVLLLMVLFLGLLVFLGIVFSTEAAGGIQRLREAWPGFREQLLSLNWNEMIASIPFAENFLMENGSVTIGSMLDRGFSNFSSFLIKLIQKSFTSITSAIVHFLFVLFILFFFFLDGKKLLDKIRSLLPLSENDTEELISEVSRITRSTLLSNIVTGTLEGLYGGLLFFLFGIPSPALWGIIIMIVSMVPVIGSNIIIIPAAIIQIILGNYAPGILLALFGILGVAISQNILRPKLLGGKSGIHPMIILLATLGGINWLGIIGFLVGPMIAALFIVIWNQFGKRYKSQLDERNAPPSR